jgi:hypothetical protein
LASEIALNLRNDRNFHAMRPKCDMSHAPSRQAHSRSRWNVKHSESMFHCPRSYAIYLSHKELPTTPFLPFACFSGTIPPQCPRPSNRSRPCSARPPPPLATGSARTS